MANRFGLFGLLPAEIRHEIWIRLFVQQPKICASPGVGPRSYPAILQTCHQAYSEGRPILYGSNTFTIQIHQTLGCWGLFIPPEARRMIKHVRVEVKLDFKGPSTTCLQNIRSAINWTKSIGPALEDVTAVLFEDDEDSHAQGWMPGMHEQTFAILMNIAAPHFVLELQRMPLWAEERPPSSSRVWSKHEKVSDGIVELLESRGAWPLGRTTRESFQIRKFSGPAERDVEWPGATWTDIG